MINGYEHEVLPALNPGRHCRLYIPLALVLRGGYLLEDLMRSGVIPTLGQRILWQFLQEAF